MSAPESAGGRGRRTSPAVLVLAWLLATVLAAGVAWWAVALIGGERRQGSGAVLTEAQVSAELAARASSEPGTAPGSTPDPTGAAADPTTPPSTPPAQPPGDQPTGDQPTGDQATGDPAPPAGGEVARTWDVTGGQVGAVCTGARIALLYATPADGWTVEVENAGPERVEVELRRGEDETEARAECVAGTPELTGSGGEDD